MTNFKGPGDIVPRDDGGEDLVPIAPWLEKSRLWVDSDDAADQIVERILAAETPEEVLESSAEAVGLRDYINQEVTITDVRLVRSSMEDGAGAFALIALHTAKDDTEVIATCGSKNVLAQLVRMDQLNAYPFTGLVYETVSKTNPKHRPMWLRPVEAPL